MNKTEINSLILPQLTDFIEGLGEKPFHAKQIFKWLSKGVKGFDEMTDLSKDLREKLSQHSFICSPEIERKLVSGLDGTVKYLLRLSDGEVIESTVMDYHHGLSICISSQVGCKMGCTFCASTVGGCIRNLTPAEILGQILTAQNDLGKKISSVVMMGIGEPLQNYDNVLQFLRILSDKNGVGMSLRHVSLSTCGIVPKILELAKENLPLTLSISLHAPSDYIRSQIMPVNNAYNVLSLIDACKTYQSVTGRRISFEYTLIHGVNSGETCAMELSKLLKGLLCHVNLITLNNVVESNLIPVKPAQVQRFVKVLESQGINVTVRRTLGSDINASCGQLRQNRLENK